MPSVHGSPGIRQLLPAGLEQRREQLDSRRRVLDSIEVSDVAYLLSSPEGRRVLWRLCEAAGILDETHEFEGNAMRISYDRGRQKSVFRLVEIARTHCVELWQTMIAEHQPKVT